MQVVLLSFFSREPDAGARNLTRRIRARWPRAKVVLGLWGVASDELDDRRREALGADAVVASIKEAVGRISLLVRDAEGASVEVVQDPQAAAVRNETLKGVRLENPELREDLDDYAIRAADVFDVRTAVIVAIEGENELVIGASHDLPGARTSDGRDLIVLPQDSPIAAQVLSDAKPVAVADIERDPVLSENAILHRWSARALAAAPVRKADGVVLGALCLIHDQVRELDDEELQLLETLAAEVAERLTGEDAAPVSEPEVPAPSASVGQQVPD